jgi:hypothetical protein
LLWATTTDSETPTHEKHQETSERTRKMALALTGISAIKFLLELMGYKVAVSLAFATAGTKCPAHYSQ